ncbi:ATM1-type heavy metal exporter [Folsomia candida]|uniref:ATP-binding cassette sub-family B member 6, mitochondrial n=1 Tax=Folsomia candida TaxID=158441 RepID=A0A226F0T1_FOLCA|nr:ATM1-type heavy metal exporter [Folsomia candida]OXA63088.1 ATP-binding cassette sub-family B member 6, mitochondrial [Folsomia candida]
MHFQAAKVKSNVSKFIVGVTSIVSLFEFFLLPHSTVNSIDFTLISSHIQLFLTLTLALKVFSVPFLSEILEIENGKNLISWILRLFLVQNIVLFYKFLQILSIIEGDQSTYFSYCYVTLLVRYVSVGILLLNELYGQRLVEAYQKLEIAKSIAHTRKVISLLKPYFIPKSYEARVSAGVCILLVLIDLPVDLFQQILNKKIMDSMTFSSSMTNNSDSHTQAKIELNMANFRWELLLLTALLDVTSCYGITHNIRTYLWRNVESDSAGRIQVEIYTRLQHQSVRWHLEQGTGGRLTKLQSSSSDFTYFMKNILLSVIPQWLKLYVSITHLAIRYPWNITCIVILTTAFLVVAKFLLSTWRSKLEKMDKEDSKAKMKKSVDALLNYETVKYFCKERYEIHRFKEAFEETTQLKFNSKFASTMSWFLENVVRTVGQTAAKMWCYWMVLGDSELTLGDFVMLEAFFWSTYAPFDSMSWMYEWGQKVAVDAADVAELLELAPEIVDVPNAPNLEVTDGEIRFENVSFSYVPEREVLSEVTFRVEAGKTMALVGPTGSGKSTVMKLIFRLYNSSSGRILIDNQDVTKVTQASLRGTIGVVPQDCVLFDDTITNNIKYGKPTDEMEQITEYDVQHAAKCACIHEAILEFPDKYDSKVGERGLKLSGGEKQRIAIARTVLKNPPILILDEATSALDTKTERKIQSVIKNICKNRTSLIVAHRLSTITHADEIVVLKGGRIVESGSHETLLAKGGEYASMWLEQLEKKDHSTTIG